MTPARPNGRFLLALSVPLLPFTGYVSIHRTVHDSTAALTAALPLSLSVAATAIFFGFLANAFDDGSDDTWRTAAAMCLSVFAMAVLGFDGALFFTLLTSTSISIYTLTTMGVFGAATVLASAGLGALIARGIGLPKRRLAAVFLAQCALVAYLLLAQNRWLAQVTLAVSALTFLFGIMRALRAPASTSGH